MKKVSEREREWRKMAKKEYEISPLWPFISWKKCCVSTKAPFERYIQIESEVYEKINNTHTLNLYKQSSPFVAVWVCMCVCTVDIAQGNLSWIVSILSWTNNQILPLIWRQTKNSNEQEEHKMNDKKWIETAFVWNLCEIQLDSGLKWNEMKCYAGHGQ